MARIKLAADIKDFLSLCLSHEVRLLIACLPFISVCFVSCAMKQDNPAACSCDEHFMSMQTGQQGVSDAKCHIREKGFRILRYDMPPVRCGDWHDYYLPFQHFGIEEADESFATLEYCRSYNGEMDRQLQKRYGTEYRQLRRKILPKSGAGHYKDPFRDLLNDRQGLEKHP